MSLYSDMFSMDIVGYIVGVLVRKIDWMVVVSEFFLLFRCEKLKKWLRLLI